MIKVENGAFKTKGSEADLSVDAFYIMMTAFGSKKSIEMVAKWMEAFAYSIKEVDCDDVYDREKMADAMAEFVGKMREAAKIKGSEIKIPVDDGGDDCLSKMASYIIDASESNVENADHMRVKIGSAFMALSKVLEGAKKAGKLGEGLEDAVKAFDTCGRCYMHLSHEVLDRLIEEAIDQYVGADDEG